MIGTLLARARERPRRRVVAVLVAVIVAIPLALLLTAGFTPLPAELEEARDTSVRVTDRAGRLLREVRASDGKRARDLSLEEMGPLVPRAIVAAEDRRFYDHHGVDPLAIGRALFDDLRHLRIVSGGSTLTMQLARTLRPHRRNLLGKWREAALAIRLEHSLPKARILEEYLNRVDFGPNLRGIGAASQAYFDKPPRALSLAEAALLAGLPRGPSLYAVTRRPDLAKRRRDRVLARMETAGLAQRAEVASALEEPLIPQKEASAFGAPHLVQGLVDGSLAAQQPGLASALARGGVRAITTTIEGPLQRAAEAATLAVLEPLASRHVTAAAVVVLDNATGELLAYVGSPSYFDPRALGQNDGARAERQPGSALKPFLYALAIEKLGFTAATSLPDVELHIPLPGGGDYAPRDYDDKLRGPVRLRQALGNSLNVPAVWTAEQVGVEALLQRLRELGFDTLKEGPAFYGPGLALGDGEVTLLALARAYATLARGGVDRPVRMVRSIDGGHGSVALENDVGARVLPEPVAEVITDILRDPRARAASFDEGEALRFAFDVAAKTGTSKGFRDNWAVGYSSAVTVAAWAGNFDGTPMDQVSGIAGAAPLFHAVMEAAMERREIRPLPIHEQSDQDGKLQRVAVCPLSGGAPTHACGATVFEWIPRDAVTDLPLCDIHEEVLIDRRNGLRAGPTCPSAQTAPRVVERYGPELDAWARAAGRPLAPDAWSPLCPGGAPDEQATVSGPLRIAYPHDGARFLIDPERPRELSAVPVLIAAPSGVRHVTLRLDGAVLASLDPPFTTTWKLEPGEHTFAATGPGGTESAPVHVTVR